MNIIFWMVNSMNEDFKIPTLPEVFASIELVLKIVDIMDDTYKSFRENYIMRYYQNRGITLRNIFIRDMLNWLCFLGWGDGYIHDNEVIFINSLLNLNLSQRDVFNIINELDENILSTLPATFQIFIEYTRLSDNNNGNPVGSLYSLFLLSGSYFIACDGDIDAGEIQAFIGYTKTLNRNIQTFDLRAAHESILDQI